MRHSRVLVARPPGARPPPGEWTGQRFWRDSFARWRDGRAGARCYSSLTCTSRTRAPVVSISYYTRGVAGLVARWSPVMPECPVLSVPRGPARANARLPWRRELSFSRLEDQGVGPRHRRRRPPARYVCTTTLYCCTMHLISLPLLSATGINRLPPPGTDWIDGRPYHANPGPLLKKGGRVPGRGREKLVSSTVLLDMHGTIHGWARGRRGTEGGPCS